MITEHGGPYGRNEGQDPTRPPDVSHLSASSPHDYRRLDATPETSAAMIREHAPKTAAVIGGVAAFMEPWGPFEMGGFEGCTDRDPDHCACATDVQPTCADCGRKIEPGEAAWSRQWPYCDTLPLDHPDQEWDVLSWHDDCALARTLDTDGGER